MPLCLCFHQPIDQSRRSSLTRPCTHMYICCSNWVLTPTNGTDPLCTELALRTRQLLVSSDDFAKDTLIISTMPCTPGHRLNGDSQPFTLDITAGLRSCCYMEGSGSRWETLAKQHCTAVPAWAAHLSKSSTASAKEPCRRRQLPRLRRNVMLLGSKPTALCSHMDQSAELDQASSDKYG